MLPLVNKKGGAASPSRVMRLSLVLIAGDISPLLPGVRPAVGGASAGLPDPADSSPPCHQNPATPSINAALKPLVRIK